MTGKTIFVFAVLCSFHCAFATTLSQCGTANSGGVCPYFFDALEASFTRNSVVPYALQRAFFPAGTPKPGLLNVAVNVTARSVPNVMCIDEEFIFGDQPLDSVNNTALCIEYNCLKMSWSWRHAWTKNIINFVIARERLELLPDVNFIAFAINAFNTFDVRVLFNTDSNAAQNVTTVESNELSLELEIPFLQCIPEEAAFRQAWEDILQWLELYATERGSVTSFDEDSRGRTLLEGDDSELDTDELVTLFLIGHVFLNCAIALLAMKLLKDYLSSLSSRRKTGSMQVKSIAVTFYWANVFIGTVCVLGILAGDLAVYSGVREIGNLSARALSFKVVSDITAAGIVLFQLFYALGIPKDEKLYIPRIISDGLGCWQCCYCCGNEKGLKILRKFIHGIALWILMVFIQFMAKAITPVLVVILRNPIPSIAFLALLIATYFCLIVFVAHLINVAGQPSKSFQHLKIVVTLVAQIFIFVTLLGLFALLVVVYLSFVRAGSDISSATGLIFSLVPTVLLSGATWVIKKKLFEDEEENDATPNDKNNVPKQSSLFKKYGSSFRKQPIIKAIAKTLAPEQKQDDEATTEEFEATNTLYKDTEDASTIGGGRDSGVATATATLSPIPATATAPAITITTEKECLIPRDEVDASIETKPSVVIIVNHNEGAAEMEQEYRLTIDDSASDIDSIANGDFITSQDAAVIEIDA